MLTRELLIISGYPEMYQEIKDVCLDLQVEPAVLKWQLADAKLIEVLNESFQKNGRPDVIISRGAIAGLIEAVLPDIVSIRAEPDGLEILAGLKQAVKVGPRVGLILYAEYILHFHTDILQELLKLQELKIYPFRTREDIIRQVEKSKADGMDALVGGGKLAERLGKAQGMPTFSVDTGKLSIAKAISQAESIIYARRQEKLQLQCFNLAAASIQEGFLWIEKGRILVANKCLGTILKTDERKLVGAEVHDLTFCIDGERLWQFLNSQGDDDAVMKLGGQRYYVKKSSLDDGRNRRTLLLLRNARTIQQQEERVRSELRRNGFTAKYHFTDIVAQSSVMANLIRKARLYAGTDANLLISGPSGTGKELLAQSIHNASLRRDRPFVAVNCAAIPQSLLESELFGYEEGAFSGAKRGGKQGLFELAHQGTIFLDEISSMPIDLQSVLLRTIQEGEVRRIGAQKNIYVDIRIIAASNKDLKELIAAGCFREDLYYRLTTLQLTLPELAKRPEDIQPLAEYFLRQYAAKYQVPPPELNDADRELLQQGVWEGNIRELENVIHRFVLLNRIQAPARIMDCMEKQELLPWHDRRGYGAEGEIADVFTSGTWAEIELKVLRNRLQANKGNRTKTAAELGISRATLWKKLGQDSILSKD